MIYLKNKLRSNNFLENFKVRCVFVAERMKFLSVDPEVLKEAENFVNEYLMVKAVCLSPDHKGICEAFKSMGMVYEKKTLDKAILELLKSNLEKKAETNISANTPEKVSVDENLLETTFKNALEYIENHCEDPENFSMCENLRAQLLKSREEFISNSKNPEVLAQKQDEGVPETSFDNFNSGECLPINPNDAKTADVWDRQGWDFTSGPDSFFYTSELEKWIENSSTKLDFLGDFMLSYEPKFFTYICEYVDENKSTLSHDQLDDLLDRLLDPKDGLLEVYGKFLESQPGCFSFSDFKNTVALNEAYFFTVGFLIFFFIIAWLFILLLRKLSKTSSSKEKNSTHECGVSFSHKDSTR